MRGQPGSGPHGGGEGGVDPTRSGGGGPGHSRARIATRGPAPEKADAAVVLIHGRGGSPEGMLTLADQIEVEGLSWLAPQADNGTWYPRSFLAELDENEPWLSSALAWLDALLRQLGGKGVSPDRVAFVGFSQGACLATEFVARHPRYYGAVAGLSGGLVGPPGTDFRARFTEGRLDGTPLFLGCSDVDPHIPEERVHESAAVLQEMGAEVEKRIYPGMGHTVVDDELAWIRERLERLG